MFILNDNLRPLQNAFSSTGLGRQRAHWVTYTILPFIIPFTTSISSNVFRCINTFLGRHVNRRRFYTFMPSNKLPWDKLWHTLVVYDLKTASMSYSQKSHRLDRWLFLTATLSFTSPLRILSANAHPPATGTTYYHKVYPPSEMISVPVV